MTHQITGLIEATTELHERIDDALVSFSDDRAGLSAARAGYEQLADDLRDTVSQAMYFVGTIDPFATNPDEVSGGTFRTLADLLAKVPRGGDVYVTLPEGRHELSALAGGQPGLRIRFGRVVIAAREDATSKPVIVFGTRDNGTHSLRDHIHTVNSTIRFSGVDLDLPARPPAASPFLARYNAAVVTFTPTAIGLELVDCDVTADDGASVVAATEMALSLGCVDSNIAGSGSLVSDLDEGVSLITTRNVAYAAGATLTDGSGTVGVNFLTS